MNLAKFLRTQFFYGTPLVAASGLGGGLNWPFLEIESGLKKKSSDFSKKKYLNFVKKVLCLCTCIG